MNRKTIYTVLVLFAVLILLLTGLVGCKKNPPTTRDITISGKVIWGGTLNGVAHATVKFNAASTTTAADGTFQLKATIPAAGLIGDLTVTHAQSVDYSQVVNAADDFTLPSVPITRVIYVDHENGNDAMADGTAGKPYKTITAALSISGWVSAKLAAGTYQAGETFPLILGENDSISGSVTDGTTIQSSSDAIYVGGNGAKISEVILKEQDFAGDHTAINLGSPGTSASLTIDRCTFYGWIQAILSDDSASLDVYDSVISDNIHGIRFIGAAGTQFSIHGSTISNNSVGMEISDATTCDFGTSAIPGANDFSSNDIITLADFRPANSGAIYAIGNTWSSATMPAMADKDTPGGETDFYINNSGNTIIFSEE